MPRRVGFRIFGTTADIGVHARGRTRRELFENAARGMFSVIGSAPVGARLRPHRTRVRAESLEMLLYAWLSDLLYLYDARDLFACDFENTTIVEKEIQSRLLVTDATRVSVRHQVKAVTLHRLRVRRTRDRLWRASVILDI